jgi:hypothetical protein
LLIAHFVGDWDGRHCSRLPRCFPASRSPLTSAGPRTRAPRVTGFDDQADGRGSAHYWSVCDLVSGHDAKKLAEASEALGPSRSVEPFVNSCSFDLPKQWIAPVLGTHRPYNLGLFGCSELPRNQMCDHKQGFGVDVISRPTRTIVQSPRTRRNDRNA